MKPKHLMELFDILVRSQDPFVQKLRKETGIERVVLEEKGVELRTKNKSYSVIIQEK